MMDVRTIRAMARDIGRAARRNGEEPAVFTQEQVDRAKGGDIEAIRHIPNLGTYLPKGWARVSLKNETDRHGVYMGDNEGKGAFFVDKGFSGAENEPAMSLKQFLGRLKPGLGYAIVEEGQFQVKIGVFAVRTSDRSVH